MSTELPEPLAAVVAALLDRHPETVTLDALAEAIGARAATPPQIDEMMRRLEAQGRTIERVEAVDLPRLLRDVLGAARELRDGGHAPTAAAIAERLEISHASVHAALLFSRTLTEG